MKKVAIMLHTVELAHTVSVAKNVTYKEFDYSVLDTMTKQEFIKTVTHAASEFWGQMANQRIKVKLGIENAT